MGRKVRSFRDHHIVTRHWREPVLNLLYFSSRSALFNNFLQAVSAYHFFYCTTLFYLCFEQFQIFLFSWVRVCCGSGLCEQSQHCPMSVQSQLQLLPQPPAAARAEQRATLGVLSEHRFKGVKNCYTTADGREEWEMWE